MTANESRPEAALESAGNATTKGSAFGLRGIRTCPDCGATAQGDHVPHDETCPVLLGVDRITAEDAAWFKRNPKQDRRTRPVTWAEAEMVLMSTGHRPTGTVVARRGGPGWRTRFFTGTPVALIDYEQDASL